MVWKTYKAHGEVRSQRRSKLIVPAVVIVLLGIVVVDLVLTSRDEPQAFSPDAPIDGLLTFPNLSTEIVDGPVAYTTIPPAGGPHAPVTQDCGIYQVPVTDENAVKSLATGAVWVAYQPELPADQIALLEEWFLGEEDVILAPYPGLPVPIVATAWGVQLPLTTPVDTRFAVFMERYTNGDQAPYPDENCAYGVRIPNQ